MDTGSKEKIEFMKEYIKFLSSTRGFNLTQLALELHNKYGRSPDMSNLSAKLRRGTLTIHEFAEILEVLDYEIDVKDLRKYEKRKSIER